MRTKTSLSAATTLTFLLWSCAHANYEFDKFWDAASQGNLEQTLYWLQQPSVDINEKRINPRLQAFGYTALHTAIENGHDQVAQALLANDHIEVNTPDNFGNTALHIAAKKGNYYITQHLVHIADINQPNVFGDTPLHLAVLNQHAPIAQLLVAKHEIITNSLNGYGKTPLDIAYEKLNPDIVALLNPNQELNFVLATIKRRNDQLFNGAKFGDTQQVFEALDQPIERRESKIDINRQNINHDIGYTPLHIAIENGHEAVLGILLPNEFIDVNKQAYNGYTPLHIAIEKGYNNIAALLLQRNDIQVNKRDYSMYTPLHLAIQKGNAVIVQMLLQRSDVDKNARTLLNLSPLDLVAEYRHDIKKLLTTRKADLDDRTSAIPKDLFAQSG